jgi:3-oxoadipate enol-lactonase
MLVLLHGVGGRASMWEPVMQELSSMGIKSVALDLPGYGANQVVLETYDFAHLCAWLSEQLRELDEPICLVGQSFGGMIALDYVARAQADPQLSAIAKLVLMTTTAAFGKPGGDWQQEFVNSRLAPLRAGKSMLEVAQSLVPAMLGSRASPHCLSQALDVMGAVPPRTYEMAVQCLSGFDRRTSLSALNLPVLCIAGIEDSSAPAKVMEKMASFIPGARLESIACGGHLLPLEYPRECARLLADFVSNDGVSP